MASSLAGVTPSSWGTTYSIARGINDVGVAVGVATDWTAGSEGVDRAVRWDVTGSLTELKPIASDALGNGNADAYAINHAGTIVGQSQRFNDSKDMGMRPVRRDAGSNVPTELGSLGGYVAGAPVDPAAFAINGRGRASHARGGDLDDAPLWSE
jgi:uncharacterized membrane protein